LEAIYATLKKLEDKETLKEKGLRTVSYTADFEDADETKVKIKRDVPFEGLVIGEEYKILLVGSQTTLDSHIQEEESSD